MGHKVLIDLILIALWVVIDHSHGRIVDRAQNVFSDAI